MLTRVNGLEGLANAALQRGIDAYVQKDYERAVADFKRAVGLGRGSAFAADAAQFLAMAYLALDDRKTPSRPTFPASRSTPTATTCGSSSAISISPTNNTRRRPVSTPRPCA